MNDVETTQETPVPELSQETSPETTEETEPSPTYKHDSWYGLDHFVCLLCGHEDWSEPTLEQHIAVYHQGVMIEAPPGYEPPLDQGQEQAVAEGEPPVPEPEPFPPPEKGASDAPEEVQTEDEKE